METLSLVAHIPNLDIIQASFGILLDVDVDGKMCVDISHLVLEAFRDPNYQVVDNGFDGSERRDILPSAVMEFDVNGVFVRSGKADGEVGEVLSEFTCAMLVLMRHYIHRG